MQLPLAASRIIGLLRKGYFADLENQLPFELIELLGWQCAASPVALEQLRKAMALRRAELCIRWQQAFCSLRNQIGGQSGQASRGGFARIFSICAVERS